MWLLIAKRLLELITGSLDARSAKPTSTSNQSTLSPNPTSQNDQTPVKGGAGLKLTLIRKWKTEKSTVGELYVDGEFFCYTLEDRDRLAEGLAKIPGLTAIPGGTYKVRLALSPKRGYVVPWIDGVPQFSYVQIHRGTKPEDSDGCVLVGRLRGPDQIAESKQAFDELMSRLQQAETESQSITLEVS